MTTCTPKQRIERLRQLRRVMVDVKRRDARERKAGRQSPFDIWNWGQRVSGDYAPSCGTVACVAGWAAHDAYFKRRGIRLTEDRRSTSQSIVVDGEVLGVGRLYAKFGLDWNQEEDHVFHMDGYPPYKAFTITPAHVIAKIDALLKKYAVKK